MHYDLIWMLFVWFVVVAMFLVASYKANGNVSVFALLSSIFTMWFVLGGFPVLLIYAHKAFTVLP